MQKIFDKDKRFVGYAEKNQPNTIFHQTPAPQDEDLDALVLTCADAVTMFKDMEQRTVSLRPCGGRYNDMLLDRIRLWVERGNLRTHQQVNEAMSQFAEYVGNLIAFGVYEKDWRLDPWALSRLDWYFRVPDSTRPPTRREIEANHLRLQQEQAERTRQDRADSARIAREMEDAKALFEASLEGKHERQVEDVLNTLVPPPDIEAMPEEKRLAARYVHVEDRERIQPYLEAIVKRDLTTKRILKLWRQGDAIYRDSVSSLLDDPQLAATIPDPEVALTNFVMGETQDMREELAQMTPGEVRPLKPGQKRLYFKTVEDFIVAYDADGEIIKHEEAGGGVSITRDVNQNGEICVTFLSWEEVEELRETETAQ